MYTPIKLDKTRNLRFRMKACRIIEKHFGKPLAHIRLDECTVEDFMTIMCAGLAHEDKDLTVEKMFDIVDECDINLNSLIEIVYGAMADAYGPEDDQEGENPPKAAASSTE